MTLLCPYFEQNAHLPGEYELCHFFGFTDFFIAPQYLQIYLAKYDFTAHNSNFEKSYFHTDCRLTPSRNWLLEWSATQVKNVHIDLSMSEQCSRSMVNVIDYSISHFSDRINGSKIHRHSQIVQNKAQLKVAWTPIFTHLGKRKYWTKLATAVAVMVFCELQKIALLNAVLLWNNFIGPAISLYVLNSILRDWSRSFPRRRFCWNKASNVKGSTVL